MLTAEIEGADEAALLALDRLPAETERAVEDQLALALRVAFLLGAYRLGSGGDAAFADDDAAVTIGGEALTMEEAVDVLRDLVAISPADFAELDAATRLRAFTIARVTSTDALRAVQDHLRAAVAEGSTAATFRERVAESLRAAGVAPLDPWRMDVVWRNGTSLAYNAGRWAQLRRLGDAVAYVQFVGVGDRRQTEVCRSLSGLTAPMDAVVWETFTPPNHHQCRSSVRAILAGTAEAEGTEPTPPETIDALPPPADGWDGSARSAADLASLPPSLLERAEAYGLRAEVDAAATRTGYSVEWPKE